MITMCVQTQLQQQDTRISALEEQHYSPEDLAAIRAELMKIGAYLFGTGSVPDVPRDKSNIKAVKS